MKKNEKRKSEKKCLCPVCDSEMMSICASVMYCEPCQKKFITCVCGQVVAEDLRICPACGKNLK